MSRTCYSSAASICATRQCEEARDGLETAQQLQAVVSALGKAKTLLVADHIEHHLEDVVGPLSVEAREKLPRLTDLGSGPVKSLALRLIG